jgi:PPOX class probable F420-dependent enzyme
VASLPANVRVLFEGANFAHVATVLPDGAPHSVPVWVGLEGDRIAFLTSPGSRKARNLAREPRIAISITDRENPHRMAQIRGQVVERIEGETAWRIIDQMSNKYLGMPYPDRSDRVVFLVEPEHAWAMNFG